MESPNLKALETRYNGYLFRSRLEARWAVFMDNLNVKYQYEPEGYDLGDGIWYLPDFWLPTFNGGCYLEVKPTKLTAIEFEKTKRLAKASGKCVILAVGPPDFICQECIEYQTCGGVENYWIYVGLMNADQAYDENRMFGNPGYEKKDLTIAPEDRHILGDLFNDAIFESRSARF